MKAIGPRDIVECVNNGPIRNVFGETHAAPMLTLGALYTVVEASDVCGHPAISVAEACPDPDDPSIGFAAERFRPVSSRKAFDGLLETLNPHRAAKRELGVA